MSYRKITVDDKVYEYVVGKTHTKIKGLEAVRKIDIGYVIDYSANLARVRPSDVAEFIREKAS